MPDEFQRPKRKCNEFSLAISASVEAAIGAGILVVTLHLHASRRAGAGLIRWIAAEHGNTRAVFGASQGDHVFAVPFSQSIDERTKRLP